MYEDIVSDAMKCNDLSGAKVRIFCENCVNTMVYDIITNYGSENLVLVFGNNVFQCPSVDLKKSKYASYFFSKFITLIQYEFGL